MKKKSRTNVNWSRHELIVSAVPEVTRIWCLKIPGTVLHQVNFINIKGRLLVTGDYGDWVFTREFIPGEDEPVSEGYWLEKLRISNPYMEFPLAWEYIKEAILKFPEEHGEKVTRYEGEYGDIEKVEYEVPEDVQDWLDELMWYAEDEDTVSYLYTAYRKTPQDIEYSNVPYSRSTPYWLDVIFDAFDEICRRIKEDK